MCVLEGGKATESEREREMLLGGKRYREIVQADWLVCKWEGAGLTNGVRDEQNEGEMATKRENVIFLIPSLTLSYLSCFSAHFFFLIACVRRMRKSQPSKEKTGDAPREWCDKQRRKT